LKRPPAPKRPPLAPIHEKVLKEEFDKEDTIRMLTGVTNYSMNLFDKQLTTRHDDVFAFVNEELVKYRTSVVVLRN
jgi:hypothetical protein